MVMCVCVLPLWLQEKLEHSPKRDMDGMGLAEIKYGDSLCFVMHMATGLWLSYQAVDVKSARLGPLKRRVGTHEHTHAHARIHTYTYTRTHSHTADFAGVFFERCF